VNDERGIIAWFARNPIASNLIMLTIVICGITTWLFGNVRMEVFPEISPSMVTVGVAYPGAAPEEVEEGICVRIEEAVHGLTGVYQVSSSANEGAGAVTIEALPETDLRALLNDIKSRVDAIDTFPAEAEKPVIQEVIVRSQVINVAVSGQADEATLKRLGERVRDELSAIPGITQVDLVSARPYEISIEVSEEALRRHGLTFDQVAGAVRSRSLDLPAGSLKTQGGEILLRTKLQAYHGREFEQLVLLSHPDGTRVLLGDVATVVDGFADTYQSSRFDGEPAVMLQVFRVGDQNALELSAKVHDYVRTAQSRMPEGIRLTVWLDQAKFLRGRLDTLVEDAGQGFLLVFLMLALFLRLKLAFWVCLDIPVSFLGAVALMPVFGVSINMLSLFSFILVLGIVVDDAIVVGENVHRHWEHGKDRVRATIVGAREVAVSVTFGVLISMSAYLPMLFMPGANSRIWQVIPAIVIPVLFFSLLDSKLVLPSHLAHMRPENPSPRGIYWAWKQVQRGCDLALRRYVRWVQEPLLRTALHGRYLTLAVFLAILLLTGGFVSTGWLRFNYFPAVEGDYVVATLVMPQGTPVETTRAIVQRLEREALAVGEELGGGLVRHVLASVGEQPYRTQQTRHSGVYGVTFTGAHLGEVNVELQPSEERTMLAADILRRWRQRVGEVSDVVELEFTANIMASGADIDVRLSSNDRDSLRAAAGELKAHLAAYDGVTDVADSFRQGKQEIKLAILPAAEPLGLSARDLARQVRQAFHGEEAQRIQRSRDDVKVMVRYPESERRSLADLERMRIRTPAGDEVPFDQVAAAEHGRGYARIQRVDRARSLHVTCKVDDKRSKYSKNDIAGLLATDFLPQLATAHPGLQWAFEGSQRNQAETLGALAQGFLVVLFLIYALMAIPLKSYLQPLIVMTAIPFGFVGAVVGHLVIGLDLTILSMFGLVALAGVAVNDSLVLVEFINQLRKEGTPLREAVTRASMIRFRAVMLTSGTTFVGLLPLVLNKSVQAQFLIPMGVSLAFGSVFATFVSLLLVPSLYLILEDLRFRRAAPASA
jgi:multidrug efflux pump subunit AcrB